MVARNREVLAGMNQRSASAMEEARRAGNENTAAIERERDLRKEVEGRLAEEKKARVEATQALARREQTIGRFVKKDRELTTRLKAAADARKSAEQTRRASQLTSAHDEQVKHDLEAKLAQEKKARLVSEDARQSAEQKVREIGARQRRLSAKLDRIIAANRTLKLALNASAATTKPADKIKAVVTGAPSAVPTGGTDLEKPRSSNASITTARQRALAEARRRAAARRVPKPPAGN